jgi:hypothetical protein
MTPLTPNDLRAYIVEILRKKRGYNPGEAPFSVDQIFAELAELCKSRGVKYTESLDAWNMNRYGNPYLHENLKAPVWEIIWDLIIEGILRPGHGHQAHELPYIHVTTFGKQAIEGSASPYDPDGYLKHLAETVPNADPIIVRYVSESAETLRRNCFLASTITLGCASEKAFLLLMDAYGQSLNTVDQPKFAKAIDKRSIKLIHTDFKDNWFDAKLLPHMKAMKVNSDWLSELENALMFVFSYFRTIRNDAGHPTGSTISKGVAQGNLQLFPRYLRLFYEFMDWMTKNKPL